MKEKGKRILWQTVNRERKKKRTIKIINKIHCQPYQVKIHIYLLLPWVSLKVSDQVCTSPYLRQASLLSSMELSFGLAPDLKTDSW